MPDISPQIDWISRLVAHDTTSADSNLPLIDDVEEYLTGLGARCVRVPNDDGTKSNLYAVVGPALPGGVILSGHTDVVPVAGQEWHSDPFKVLQKDGKLFGRGTTDMKSFSAIGLSLVPEMLAAGLKRPIIFALSYDEEIGCFGAPRMIDEIIAREPRPAAVFVGEPTMMKVINGHKGINDLQTTVKGYITHSSQPQRGVSAVMVAARLITFLESLATELAQKANPSSPFIPPHSTMTVNVINGGVITNIMAGECIFSWDIRTVPGDSAAEIVARFETFCAEVEQEIKRKSPDCSISTQWRTNVPHLAPVEDNQAADLAKALSGLNHTEVVSYAAEAGQFQNAGLPTVICGPGSIDQAHQPNEFISLDQVEKATVFLRRLIKHLAS